MLVLRKLCNILLSLCRWKHYWDRPFPMQDRRDNPWLTTHSPHSKSFSRLTKTISLVTRMELLTTLFPWPLAIRTLYPAVSCFPFYGSFFFYATISLPLHCSFLMMNSLTVIYAGKVVRNSIVGCGHLSQLSIAGPYYIGNVFTDRIWKCARSFCTSWYWDMPLNGICNGRSAPSRR